MKNWRQFVKLMTHLTCYAIMLTYTSGFFREFIWKIHFLHEPVILNFDYFIPGSWDHQCLLECVFQTIQVLTLYDFKVRVFVFDGASANLAVKLLCGNTNGNSFPCAMERILLLWKPLFKTHMKINQGTKEYLLLFAHLTRLAETLDVARVNNVNRLFN